MTTRVGGLFTQMNFCLVCSPPTPSCSGAFTGLHFVPRSGINRTARLYVYQHALLTFSPLCPPCFGSNLPQVPMPCSYRIGCREALCQRPASTPPLVPEHVKPLPLPNSNQLQRDCITSHFLLRTRMPDRIRPLKTQTAWICRMLGSISNVGDIAICDLLARSHSDAAGPLDDSQNWKSSDSFSWTACRGWEAHRALGG